LPFVIDLNVLRTVWTGIDPQGNRDYESWGLFREIYRTCDKIVVTDGINRRYLNLYHQLKEKYPQGADLLNFGRLYLRWKETPKVDEGRMSSQLPPVRCESSIKDEDKEFARLAKLTGAVLVTFDGALIEAGHKCAFKAMTPNDVLKTGGSVQTPRFQNPRD